MSAGALPAHNIDNAPDTIRIKRNWCVHRTDGEKPKVPHAIGGYKLQWSIPANWINFLEIMISPLLKMMFEEFDFSN